MFFSLPESHRTSGEPLFGWPHPGGIVAFYDLLDPNIEVTSDAGGTADVLDAEGAAVPGLFLVNSMMVTPGGYKEEAEAFGGADAADGADDAVAQENSISGPSAFNYTAMPFGSKKEFQEWLKEYVLKCRQTMKDKGIPQEKIKEFMADAKVFCPFLLKKFKDLTPYMASNCNADGAIIFEYWPDESASCPSFVYIKGGLIETKC